MIRTTVLVVLLTALSLSGCGRDGVRIPPPEISDLKLSVEHPDAIQSVEVFIQF
ncbi:MAG: hypothetical protein M0P69_04550 [Bacteroidales bacterium]|jgi:predicted small lipoprotein YifL|nr:hypothetical protein [Bacteroidales bacterium]MDD2570038.1 hypothetical protein [Bacteroidales bacterium]MDD2812240.1 hypothetical protein [Bacteroidales bacterium]MDD3385270.1 hypothetical protein [Bacteroidales bacterium]MDD3811110.1 hypothetical protein [Bacteroidales bacterium]